MKIVGRSSVAFGLSMLVLAVASASALGAQVPESSCISCHGALGDERLSAPASSFEQDVHAAQGFGCVSCHGGDASEMSLSAMDPARGYIGVPERRRVPGLCGRCHSDAQFMRRFDPALRVDQVAEYRTSVHGQRLLEMGDSRVATCSDCHGVHSIRPPSDPNSQVHPLRVAATCGSCHADPEYMAPYDVPTDQLLTYTRSVHWQMLSVEGDLSAPTCNDCHGNHGAAPPGVSWVGNVCGQCHTVMSELYSRSAHFEIFTRLGSPGCATCHGNHAIERAGDELLGLGEEAVCGRCHTGSGKGGAVAARMRTLIDSLKVRYAAADSVLARAEDAGMEVSQAQFALSDATSALVRARTTVHTFDLDSVAAAVEPGLEIASRAYDRGVEAMRELQFRRMGLAVSVGIILLLIVGLVLKIRQLEERA